VHEGDIVECDSCPLLESLQLLCSSVEAGRLLIPQRLVESPDDGVLREGERVSCGKEIVRWTGLVPSGTVGGKEGPSLALGPGSEAVFSLETAILEV
jgi:hypothetical protein